MMKAGLLLRRHGGVPHARGGPGQDLAWQSEVLQGQGLDLAVLSAVV
jgi:hypothetical protein